jgi:hypothetical protein
MGSTGQSTVTKNTADPAFIAVSAGEGTSVQNAAMIQSSNTGINH